MEYLSRTGYSNCKMLSPDGVLMCRLSKKRANWYVERNLAKVVDKYPYTIQLLFEPNGLGNHQDDYYLGEKANICVVCGSAEKLTKHHAVPRCFRRHFPNALKKHESHDVLLVCKDCHEEYETHATRLKKELMEDIWNSDMVQQRSSWIRAVRAAKTLEKWGDRIPEDGVLDLMIRIEECIGDFNDEIVQHLISTPIENKFNSSEDWKKGLEDFGDYIEFNKVWRKHFVDTMKPKFLPKFWDVNKDNYSEKKS